MDPIPYKTAEPYPSTPPTDENMVTSDDIPPSNKEPDDPDSKNNNYHEQLPLLNPDILEQIFCRMASPELKVCRLVCRTWEEIANIQLGKETIFAVNQLDFTTTLPEEDGIPSVDPRLLRRIGINLSSETGTPVAVPLPVFCILPFLAVHRGDIEEITLRRGDTFLSKVSALLDNVEFPKLTKLSLFERSTKRYGRRSFSDPEEDDWFGNPSTLSPSVMVALTSVKILELSITEDFYMVEPYNSSDHQLLINNCPNLEELKIIGYYYPDLTGSVRLKSLTLVGPRSRGWSQSPRYYKPNTRRLVTMLEGVQWSLEELSIGSKIDDEYDSSYVDTPDTWKLKYPAMPELKRLFIADVSSLAISPDSFSRDRLPALKTLVLRSSLKFEYPIKELLGQWITEEEIMEGKCEKVVNTFLNANSLSINQFPCGEILMLHDICTAFPNLKELSLGITVQEKRPEIRRAGYPPLCFYSKSFDWTMVAVTDVQLLKNTLTAISNIFPSLEKLTIYVKFCGEFAELLGALCSGSFTGKGKGLKWLKLVAPISSPIEDYGCDNFKGPFDLCENLVLEGFLVKEETRRKMHEFCVEQKFKVYFLH